MCRRIFLIILSIVDISSTIITMLILVVIAVVAPVMTLVSVVLLCLKHRTNTRNPVERCNELTLRGEAIYSEIAEHPGKSKKAKTKTTSKELDLQLQQDVPERISSDVAPDIITAHDGESIYETLDSKRNRSYIVQTNLVTSQPQTLTDPDGDQAYDHLDRMKQLRLKGSDKDMEHFLMEENASLQMLPHAKLRPITSSERATQKLFDGQDMFPYSDCLRFSEEDSASCRSSSRSDDVQQRAKIVCRLVGVLGNGEQVIPVKPEAANHTYFILEPEVDIDLDKTRQVSSLPLAPARFRIVEEKSTGLNKEESAQKCSENTSDYFILEPVDENGNISEISSRHNEHSSSSSPQSVLKRNDSSLEDIEAASDDRKVYKGKQSSFRSRTKSFPSPSATPPMSPARPHDIRRSVSYSATNSNEENDVKDRKLDPVFLQTRIQQEMRALGFYSSETDQNLLCQNRSSNASSANEEEPLQGTEACRREVPNSSPRMNANQYFVLEANFTVSKGKPSERDDYVHIDTYTKHSPKNSPKPAQAAREADECGARGTYIKKGQSSLRQPPRLPERNYLKKTHSRSRSETPTFSPQQEGQPRRHKLAKCHSLNEEEPAVLSHDLDDEGPVIVSLKKFRSGNLSTCEENALNQRS